MGKFSLFSPPLGAFNTPPVGDCAAIELDGADHEAYASVQSDPIASFCSQYNFGGVDWSTFVGQSCQNSIFGDVWYHIKRTSLAFETSILTGLTPNVATLRLQPWLTYFTRNYATRIDVVLAPGTHRPAIASDYGVIGGDNTVIGFLDVPFPAGLSDAYHDIAIPVVDLDLSGYSLWALRSDDDVTVAVPPGCSGAGPIGFNNMVGIRGAGNISHGSYFTQFPEIVSVAQVGINAVATGRLNDPTPWAGGEGQPARLDITVAEAVDGSNLDIRFYYYSDTHPVVIYLAWQPDVALGTDLSAVITPPAGSTSLTVGFQMRLNHDSSLLLDGGEITIPFTSVVPPTVETDAATGVALAGATLNGTLDSDGGDSPVTCSFQWGTTGAYGNTTAGQVVASGNSYSVPLAGLINGTLYHFRAKAVGTDGSTTYGLDMTFTTLSLLPVMPTVETDLPSVSYSGATFNGKLDDDGGMPCDCGFEWGTTPALGNTTLTGPQVTGETFSQLLTGFTLGTTYYFRAFATNIAGTAYGAILSFNLVKRNQAYVLSRSEI